MNIFLEFLKESLKNELKINAVWDLGNGAAGELMSMIAKKI